MLLRLLLVSLEKECLPDVRQRSECNEYVLVREDGVGRYVVVVAVSGVHQDVDVVFLPEVRIRHAFSFKDFGNLVEVDVHDGIRAVCVENGDEVLLGCSLECPYRHAVYCLSQELLDERNAEKKEERYQRPESDH